jgi:integrase
VNELLIIPSTQSIQQEMSVDTTWLRFFDPNAAVAAVAAHVETLPSSRTPERHTRRAYMDGLRAWLSFSCQALPTADLVERYIAALLKRGLKSATVSAKYLAPLRLYLKKLAGQRIPGLSGWERDFVTDCRDHILAAIAVRSPKPETSTNISPLWDPRFTRLSMQQVNAVLRGIDRATRAGLRDYAFLHIAFSSGLRIAEMHRITLESLSAHADGYIITVRGKRSNVDPVPISNAAARDLMAWVDAFNADLPPADPRRIESDRPVWQPLRGANNHAVIGVNGCDPKRGLSQSALRDIIAKRTTAVLGEKFALAAHDTRRTAAAIAYEAGMGLPEIQALLRHKDAAVTLRYVGTKPDYKSRSLSSYVDFG